MALEPKKKTPRVKDEDGELAGEEPVAEELGGAKVWGRKDVLATERAHCFLIPHPVFSPPKTSNLVPGINPIGMIQGIKIHPLMRPQTSSPPSAAKQQREIGSIRKFSAAPGLPIRSPTAAVTAPRPSTSADPSTAVGAAEGKAGPSSALPHAAPPGPEMDDGLAGGVPLSVTGAAGSGLLSADSAVATAAAAGIGVGVGVKGRHSQRKSLRRPSPIRSATASPPPLPPPLSINDGGSGAEATTTTTATAAALRAGRERDGSEEALRTLSQCAEIAAAASPLAWGMQAARIGGGDGNGNPWGGRVPGAPRNGSGSRRPPTGQPSAASQKLPPSHRRSTPPPPPSVHAHPPSAMRHPPPHRGAAARDGGSRGGGSVDASGGGGGATIRPESLEPVIDHQSAVLRGMMGVARRQQQDTERWDESLNQGVD